MKETRWENVETHFPKKAAFLTVTLNFLTLCCFFWSSMRFFSHSAIRRLKLSLLVCSSRVTLSTSTSRLRRRVFCIVFRPVSISFPADYGVKEKINRHLNFTVGSGNNHFIDLIREMFQSVFIADHTNSTLQFCAEKQNHTLTFLVETWHLWLLFYLSLISFYKISITIYNPTYKTNWSTNLWNSISSHPFLNY